jgi:hypothetical protein
MLKGFASSRRGDEVKVWMYRKDGCGVELNITNVGVEKDFYGKQEESDLDERITTLETTYGLLVDELRSHSAVTTAVNNPQIPNLIAHLALRTRHLRESVLRLSDSMVQTLRAYLSRKEIARAALIREIRKSSELRQRLSAQLVEKGIPIEKLDLVMEHLDPQIAAFVEQLLPEWMPKFDAYLDAYMSKYRSVLSDTVRESFIRAMSSNLSPEPRAAMYAAYKWFVVRTNLPVLLGDTVCLFETAGERRFKPLDDKADDVRRVYLPLASNLVLIGTLYSSGPQVDCRVLNKAIARCSLEFFVSSLAIPVDSPLVRHLGGWSGILNEQEMHILMEDLKCDFLRS